MTTRSIVLLLLMLQPFVLVATEQWVFLKDGRVGKTNARATTASFQITLEDGEQVPVTSADVAGWRSLPQLEQAVDAMLWDMTRGRKLSEHVDRLKIFKWAATSRLLHHLESKVPLTKLGALYGLQYCWTNDCLAPVLELVSHSQADIRKVAQSIIQNHVERPVRERQLRPRLETWPPLIAAEIYENLLGEVPDPALVGKLLQHQPCWCHLRNDLPRYHVPAFRGALLQMIEKGDATDRCMALATFIHQYGQGPENAAVAVSRLKDADPQVRELAAEVLTWHGNQSHRDPLFTALSNEPDAFALASMRAAVDAIQRRSMRGTDLPEWVGGPVAIKVEERMSRYRSATDDLRKNRSAETLLAALGLLQFAEPFEPTVVYGGKEVDEAFRRWCDQRLGLMSLLFGIPGEGLAETSDYLGGFKADVATVFQPPLRDYLDPRRKSFGFSIPKRAPVFGNSVHVGDDVGWHAAHRTVVAIGDGVVRRVACTPSWGYILIIEHRLADDSRLCSLYAHLSPFVHVQPGDMVRKGQKVGAVGRSDTWENGGYRAHLHFGIHQGSYLRDYYPGTTIVVERRGQKIPAIVVGMEGSEVRATFKDTGDPVRFQRSADWICGYVGIPQFENGDHGWLDPQVFLREHSR